jgi:hypothetical protein
VANTSPVPPRFCIISTPIFCGSINSRRATIATRNMAPALCVHLPAIA